MKRLSLLGAAFTIALLAVGCATNRQIPKWEQANPVQPIPAPPLGIDFKFTDLKEPPTPERARLGRWLFYDARLSGDGKISCATCHRPENGFSEPTPHSTGIDGKEGSRKAPPVLNLAWTLYPNFFWDGRAATLEEQALGPIANPVEMGSTHEVMIKTLGRIQGYAPYFKEAFGTPEITKDRVAKAIADYERICLTGNSPWDRWKAHGDDEQISAAARLGDELFFGKAGCDHCHLGPNLTDSTFHNVGIGWNPARKTFADEGRFAVSKSEADRGAFKTPTLRDVALHAPYMHDGSLPTLRDVVAHYEKGGTPNPQLDPTLKELDLTDAEVDSIVAFLESLTGEVPRDKAPAAFPE